MERLPDVCCHCGSPCAHTGVAFISIGCSNIKCTAYNDVPRSDKQALLQPGQRARILSDLEGLQRLILENYGNSAFIGKNSESQWVLCIDKRATPPCYPLATFDMHQNSTAPGILLIAAKHNGQAPQDEQIKSCYWCHKHPAVYQNAWNSMCQFCYDKEQDMLHEGLFDQDMEHPDE